MLVTFGSQTVDYEYSPFFLRDSRVRETRARVKITSREKRHGRSRFARLTIPEEKWGTTRSLLKRLIFTINKKINEFYNRFCCGRPLRKD